MSKLFERLCKLRGFDDNFLHPVYENLADSFLLPDMKKAITRIKQAIEQQEKILIYGDYDVDGVTASALMEETLLLAGVRQDNIKIMLPDRFADGYGMSPRLVEFAKDNKIKLVITVDCGSSNREIVEELNDLEIDSIITDHHEAPNDLPRAIAVINPHRKDQPVERLLNLAGVGVAFMVSSALVKNGMIRAGQEKWLMDLVVLGTICDSMLLTGENRILGFYGLKVLSKTRRPGLKELMVRAGVKSLDSQAIGFQIGPRLNAAGRLESADISLNLLRAKSLVVAAPLVEKLEQLNKKRKDEQLFAMREIKERGVSNDPVIVKSGKWHEGVLGIIAGHLVEEYKRPAFALTEVSDGYLKGSGRSFGDFNLAGALSNLKDIIVGGGGHAGAAGVRLEKDRLKEFEKAINDYYQSLGLKNQERYFKKQEDLEISDFSDLGLDFLDELQLLEPFGPGNEEPIFRLKDVEILGVTRMGREQNHLRLDLRDKNNKSLKCLAFYAPENWLKIDPQFDKIEPLVRFSKNDFNGVSSFEARLVDIDFLD